MKNFSKYLKDPFFSNVVICFMILCLELPIYVITQYIGLQIEAQYILMSIVWIASALFMYLRLKRIYRFDLLAINTQPSSQQMSYAVAIASLFVVFTNILYGGLKLLVLLSNNDLMYVLLMSIYNISELLIVMIMIILAQHFGERITANPLYAYGGGIVGILWGFLYVMARGYILGTYIFVLSICAGCIYLLVRKNPKITFILLILMYLL